MEHNNSQGEVTTVDNVTVYEVSYLLLPFLALEQVSSKVESLRQTLTSLGGAMISLESPTLVDLSYPMMKVVQTVRHKVTTAYFGWVKFEMSPAGIEAIKKALDNDDTVIRYLIIKTVRENTLLNGKMMLKKEEKAKRGEEDVLADAPEVLKEMPVEELDKSIDDLVIV